MPSVTINGNLVTTVYGPGALVITQVEGRVLINGQDVTPDDDAKQVLITVTGDVESLEARACHSVTVAGSAGAVRSDSGTVRVEGPAQTVTTSSGTVTCGDVGGDVRTSSGTISRR